MLHFLIGLAIATVMVMGWATGNLFVLVFLTLADLCVLGFGMMPDVLNKSIAIWAALFLLVIWAPRFGHVRHR